MILTMTRVAPIFEPLDSVHSWFGPARTGLGVPVLMPRSYEVTATKVESAAAGMGNRVD